MSSWPYDFGNRIERLASALVNMGSRPKPARAADAAQASINAFGDWMPGAGEPGE
jgi:hypothetical protein